MEQAFRHLEEKRQTMEQESNKIRGKLEGYRVEMQGWKVRLTLSSNK